MSSKKITWRFSRSIAERIANKAFEHLIDPIEAPMKDIARKVIDEANIDWKTLHEHKIVTESLGSAVAVDILPHSYTVPEGHEIVVWVEYPYNTHRYDNMRFFDDAAYDQLIDLQKRRNALVEKREALNTEIIAQIEGKTVNVVCKAWPEAEQIIKLTMGIGDGVSITRPLEDLLKRFLPMLPAPTKGD